MKDGDKRFKSVQVSIICKFWDTQFVHDGYINNDIMCAAFDLDMIVSQIDLLSIK